MSKTSQMLRFIRHLFTHYIGPGYLLGIRKTDAEITILPPRSYTSNRLTEEQVGVTI